MTQRELWDLGHQWEAPHAWCMKRGSAEHVCSAAPPGPHCAAGEAVSSPLPAAVRGRSAEQLAILQFPLVTKLHMFRKLNLCRRLVVPSQKIQSDLYIALHKFLVNLYNHLERESLLASQPTAAMATSVTETAGALRGRAGYQASTAAQPEHRPLGKEPRPASCKGNASQSELPMVPPPGMGQLLLVSLCSANLLPSVALLSNRQTLNVRLPRL